MMTDEERELLLAKYMAESSRGAPDGVIGFVLNPKSREILAAVIDGLVVTIVRPDGSRAGSGRFEEYEDDYGSRKTGLSRIHVAETDDVRRGSGDGTALYSAMALAAHAFYKAPGSGYRRPMEVGDGVCSFHCEGEWGRTPDASAWWDSAVKKHAMATRRVYRSKRLGKCVVDSFEYGAASELGLVLMESSEAVSVDLLSDPSSLVGKFSIVSPKAAARSVSADWNLMSRSCDGGARSLVDLFAKTLLVEGMASKSAVKKMYESERSGSEERRRRVKMGNLVPKGRKASR